MPLQAIEDTDFGVSDALDTLTETTATALKSMADRIDKIEAKSRRPAAVNDNIAFKTAAANDNNHPLVAEKKALADFVRHNVEIKMSANIDPDGGYGVTPQLSADIVRRLYDQSPIRQISRVVNVGSFDSYQEPYQVGDTGAQWVSEKQDRPGLTTPSLGMIDIPVNEIYSTQPVTQRLLDDSRFDMASFVIERVANKFSRAEGTAFVSGTGLNQPRGFLTYTTDPAADFTRDRGKLQHVVTAGSGTVTVDDVKSLFWSLRGPHRTNAAFVMSSATASVLDSLKDGNGRYIWRESAALGLPPTLLGKPVYFAEDMPSIAANALPIAFGNFQAGYVIAEKEGNRFLRDPYSSKPNVLFYAYRRVGGGVADFDAIKLLKIKP
ncbi:phage major capsid protein [Tardiphaga sp. 839_C3_N1_4]|uniref:phage major capsid protein n=1 Tax=Tardiphaga sp. 839_C3_N1_4 TaxID=3240761 RepID=UPI003F251482